jgi:apolipoprotein N-acyltransferase
VTLAGLVIITPVLGLFLAGAGLGTLVLRKSYRFPFALAAPLAFVTFDLLRSFILTGFPWLYAGHALYRQRLAIQIADLAGSFGVTALVIALNGGLVDLGLAMRRRQSLKSAGIGAGVVAVLWVASLVYGGVRMRPGEPAGPKLLLIQGNIPQAVKDSGDSRKMGDIWDIHIRLTLEGAKEAVDLIVWPETMVPSSISVHPEMLKGLLDMAEDLDTPLLVGTVRIGPVAEDAFGTYNSAVLVRKNGTLGAYYDKIHRVPGGEYIPFRGAFPVLERILREMFGYLPDVNRGRSLRLLAMTDREGRAWPFGVLVCYENIFPELARGQVRQGARFLVNVTNEGWFGEIGEQEQILAIACFRAVENRVTVIRAANTGISAFVGPDGEIYAVLERAGRRKGVEGTLTGRVRIDGRGTVYRSVGNLFGWAVGVLVLGLWIFALVKALRKSRRNSA